MLNILRKKKVMKRIILGLAMILIPAFILWGAGSAVRSKVQGYNYAGEISDKKVSFKDLAGSRQGVRIQLLLDYFNQGPILNNVLKDRALVNRLAWERLIMLDDAQKKEIAVSDQEVVGFITNHPLFLRQTGFDKKLYERILQTNLGVTPRDFEEKIRENLRIAKLRDMILKDIDVDDEEVRDWYRKENEKARFSYVLVGKNKFKENMEISEEEISSFFNKNSAMFVEPEKINAEYIAFKYETPEEKEIAIDSLVGVLSEVQKNPSKMDEVAAAKGVTLEETGFFAKTEAPPKVGWDRDFYGKAFALRKGELGEPIIPEGEKGTCYIIKLKDISPSRQKTLEEARPAIINILEEKKAMELSNKEADTLCQQAQREALSLKDLAKNNSLDLKYSGFAQRSDYIEGLGEGYMIVDEAFKLKEGEISGPIATRAGFVIISPEGFLTTDEERFEAEKDEYGKKVLAAKKMRALDDWFRGISTNAELVVDVDRL